MYVNYEAVGILLPMALCCLSTSFICLYSASYLVNRWFTKCLKILAAAGCFIGGEMITTVRMSNSVRVKGLCLGLR